MIAILEANPLLLLFLVAAIGYWIGRIRLAGNRLGVAAVLFVGLAFGALDPALQIPDVILNLGLILFVYTIGLANGASFFAAFRGDGRRDLLFIIGLAALPALLLALFFPLLGLSAAQVAGIFAGTSTNTPALAGVLDLLTGTLSAAPAQTAVAGAVVSFSIIYPVGVLGRMATIAVTRRLWRIDFAAEAHDLRHRYPVAQNLGYRTIVVTQPQATRAPLRELRRAHEWDVVWGRLYRGEQITLLSGDTVLQPGDRIVIAGAEEEMDRVTEALGETAVDDLLHEHAVYVSRRVFVSNPAIAGKPVSALNLKEQCGALVSHVRRGDVELLVSGDTVLELGDRVRVLARRRDLPTLTNLFGDSYNAISEVNLLTTGLGITLGLLIGLIPFPLPGDITFRLGFAGGPLLVALLLGALRRTGPVVWTMPYSANLTLRQFGLICLLATIGVRSGNALVDAFTGGAGWWILLVGTAVTLVAAFAAMFAGYKLLRIPYSLLIGMISPQPAVLSYALEQAGNPLPNVGYTLMFPIATIVNVVLAQVLLIMLG